MLWWSPTLTVKESYMPVGEQDYTTGTVIPASNLSNIAEELLKLDLIDRIKALDDRLKQVEKSLAERLQRMEDLLDEIDGRLVDLDLPYR